MKFLTKLPLEKYTLKYYRVTHQKNYLCNLMMPFQSFRASDKYLIKRWPTSQRGQEWHQDFQFLRVILVVSWDFFIIDLSFYYIRSK